MSDCENDHHHNQSARRLLAAFAVISVFMVVEVIGGLLSGSLALLADATHMLTDAFALALAASAHWFASRPADKKLHFGYRRTQVLAAFVNGIALVILLAWIVYEAVRRYFDPMQVDWAPMLVIAFIGLLANAVAFVLLHGAPGNDINVRGAMLHVISDLLGSVAAIIAAVVIALSGWMRIDPLLSILVAVLIGRSAYKLLRETGHILLEGAPDNIDVPGMVKSIKAANPDVEDIHHVQIWQLTPDQPRLTMHARVSTPGDAQKTLDAIKANLKDTFGIEQSTIQIEFDDSCPDCGKDAIHAPSKVDSLVEAGGQTVSEASLAQNH